MVGRAARGGGGGGGGGGGAPFRPMRVLDFGSGVGLSGAAALDVFGVSRSGGAGRGGRKGGGESPGIDWVHSIDKSWCMRETTKKVLWSMLEQLLWEEGGADNGGNGTSYLEEEERLMLAEYKKLLFGGNDGGGGGQADRRAAGNRAGLNAVTGGWRGGSRRGTGTMTWAHD